MCRCFKSPRVALTRGSAVFRASGRKTVKADGGYSHSACGERRGLWEPKDLADTAPTRQRVWKTSHCGVNSMRGLARHSLSEALEATEIRRAPDWDHQSVRSGLYRTASEYQMGHRYYYYSHARRLNPFDSRPQFVFSAGDWVVDAATIGM